MDRKPKDSIIPLSLRLNPAEHFQLRELARHHHRSMNEEAINLIEEAAKDMRLKLDTNDKEFSDWAGKAAEKAGKPKSEYIEGLKADYEKRHEEKKFSENLGRKMYRDDVSEEEAAQDFYDLMEKVKPMNPDKTDWTEYTRTKDTSGMVEVRDRLIKAIRSGILNGPKEDIPVSLKDFDDFKEQVKSEIIETIRDELRTPDSAKEGS